MPYIDYKFLGIKSKGNFISRVQIAIYSGDITTVNETIPETGAVVPVTRYRRTARVAIKTFTPNSNMTFLQLQLAMNKKLITFLANNFPTYTLLPNQLDTTNATDIGAETADSL